MAGEDQTADAVRCDRFELKQKRFGFVSTYRDHTGRVSRDPFAADLILLRSCITSGTPIPDRMYRKKIGLSYDELLDIKGVKHLHLGSQNSNVLLYIIEFDDFVVALEVNDHKHLDKLPVGKILSGQLMAPLKYAKAKLLVEVEKDRAKKAERARQISSDDKNLSIDHED